MYVQGVTGGGKRKNPMTMIVMGIIMLFIGLVEIVASIVIGEVAGTCNDSNNFDRRTIYSNWVNFHSIRY